MTILNRDTRKLNGTMPLRVRLDQSTKLLEVSFEASGKHSWVYHPAFWTVAWDGTVLPEPGYEAEQNYGISVEEPPC